MATAGSPGRKTNTGHMSEPGALVVPFVFGRDFNVAEIQILLRQALTRALCATGGGLATPNPFVGATEVLLRQALTRALCACRHGRARRACGSFLPILRFAVHNSKVWDPLLLANEACEDCRNGGVEATSSCRFCASCS